MAVEALARHVQKHLTSTLDLASFVVKRQLPAGVLDQVMKKVAEEEEKEKRLNILNFLAFVNFPEEIADQMVDAFLEQEI